MALDLISSCTRLTQELYSRAGEFDGGNSSNRLDYVQVDPRGSTLVVDLGMTLVSRSYASLVEAQIRRVINDIKRDYDIPYSVSLDWGFVLDD